LLITVSGSAPLLRSGSTPHYAMTLFVAGAWRRSLHAVENVRSFCEEELTNNYHLEIVDLYRSPKHARTARIIAAPTLVRHEPIPARRLLGDMADRERLRAAVEAA
jgi:circadian clock protein KaiB